MDPATDPEALIASSVYWYPLIFPTRTEVLDHLLLTNGNGYEWGADGSICSVFSHIKPDYDRMDNYETEAREYEATGMPDMAAWRREERTRLLAIRADYRNLARTYGPVRTSEQIPGTCERGARMVGSEELAHWTLLGRAPANVTPAWQRVIDETRLLFAPVLVEQGALL